MAMIRGRALQSSGPPVPILVPFSTGTDAQIALMIQSYYDGIFSLQDIQSVWSVGDTRDISLSAMSGSGVIEAHVGGTKKIEILDFDHDTLTTPVGEITKALITVDTKAVLYDTDNDLYEKGLMNATRDNVWPNSDRFYWCNNTFYDSLPNYIKSMVKNVDKLTSAGNRSSSIESTSQKCFLLSEIETIGTINKSFSGEGYRYALFSNSGSSQKSRYEDQMNSVSYWLRSPADSSSPRYCRAVGGTETTNTQYPDTGDTQNVAPAFCL